ncbi:DNA alkylation repair protein [Tessaracoccus caeni]|uniref:DNA alkylation repair protein n=1 Tax=Tessaracoccus caeni TaxID=3031239 RepID=UPI0023D9B6B5|nr:DNA alkylation repair protein [Tessaracoccus caeni]MDF1489891.1 DNA alkylation repair protein [Tessaracoccus caeni]
MDFDALLADFREHADPVKADGMRAYMRDQFDFLGVPTPLRKTLTKVSFAESRTAAAVDWGFVDACWECPYRELQYVAVGYLSTVSRLLGPNDVDRLKRLAQTKSWWDTIDGLDRIVGDIALAHPHVNETLLEWSIDDDFWLRRIAIDHQLQRKGRMDTALLERIIVNNLGQKEFFVNKAIGWALRDYSKTDPEWVRRFVETYRDRLAPLSIREGTKYV